MVNNKAKLLKNIKKTSPDDIKNWLVDYVNTCLSNKDITPGLNNGYDGLEDYYFTFLFPKMWKK